MGLRQPATRSSTHKPSVRELPASERCSFCFGRLVLTQHLNTAYQSRLGRRWTGLSVSPHRFISSTRTLPDANQRKPDEGTKRNNTRESCALECVGEVGMTTNWLDLLIGTGLGTALGILGNREIGTRWLKWSERRAQDREYHPLAGHYVKLPGQGRWKSRTNGGNHRAHVAAPRWCIGSDRLP